jgi:oxaloacetate decarboxylase gamma subunit
LNQDLVSQGIELTLFGMGTVVVFLTLLVFITAGMSAFVARFFPPPPPPPASAPSPAPAASDARLMAVISAAVYRYREQHGHPTPRSTSKQDHTP